MGGMGPAATCDLMAKVIAMTDAADDQHHKAIGNGVGMTHSCFGRFYSEFGRWVKSSP